MGIKFEKANKKLHVEFDTSNLTPAHQRLVKSLNAALAQILNSGTEAEFFNGSAELMRLAASIIQQAKFHEMNADDGIPYAEQVLEFSVDALQEQMSAAKVITYDN